VFFHRVSDGGEVKVHRFEVPARILQCRFATLPELVLADEIRHALLHFVGQRGEPAHVGKENMSLRAARRRGKAFRAQQFFITSGETILEKTDLTRRCSAPQKHDT